MSRKDFELIARVIHQWRIYGEHFTSKAVRNNLANEIAARLADALSDTNPRFDQGRFLAACGVDLASFDCVNCGVGIKLPDRDVCRDCAEGTDHAPVGTGLCPVCDHYGDDCTGRDK